MGLSLPSSLATVAVSCVALALACEGAAQVVTRAAADTVAPLTGQNFGFITEGPALPCGGEEAWRRGYRFYRKGRLAEALHLFDSLHVGLASCPQALSPAQRARVLLARARIDERQHRALQAMTLAVEAVAPLSEPEHAGLLADGYLVIALLHEIAQQGPEALEAIARVERLVHRYPLPGPRSTYYVRASSIQRFFGDQALARRLADSALVAARLSGRYKDESDAVFLQVILDPEVSPTRRIAAFRTSAQIFETVGDIDGRIMMFANVARANLEQGRWRSALATLDTALAMAQVAQGTGFAIPVELARVYELRGRAFRASGMHDSAYVNFDRAHSRELAHAYGFQAADILRVDEARQRARIEAQLDTERALRRSEGRRERQLWIGIAGLTLGGIALAYVAWMLARARHRVAREVQRQVILHDELQHRVRNNFQMLISFLELSAERADGAAAAGAFETMAQRIHNLAAVHARLYETDAPGGNDAARFIEGLVGHFRDLLPHPELIDIRLDLEPLPMRASHLTAVGIIINELFTNSVKHGTGPMGDEPLAVEVRLRRKGDNVELDYRNLGPGVPADAERAFAPERDAGQLGAYLVSSFVRQLRGSIATHNSAAGGFAIEIRFPLQPLAPAPSPAVGVSPIPEAHD